MPDYKAHLIKCKASIREALIQLDSLGLDSIVFLVDDDYKLVGSLTDGDVRRGLIRGQGLEDYISNICNTAPKFIIKGSADLKKVIEYRGQNFRILPVLNQIGQVVNIINFRYKRSYLPLDAVVMAGGRGSRLKPLTDTVPKPMLTINDKPIIQYNIERLESFGIDDIWISVNYLGEQIQDHFGSGKGSLSIEYVWEDEPLGTIGAISKIENLTHDYVLVTNSDIITDLDYEDFFFKCVEGNADMGVVTIPYEVKIPYAVLQTNDGNITSFAEKPTYCYFSNGGIYIIKKSLLNLIPKNSFYNATDLMEFLISQNKQLLSYPLAGYWLDVGTPEDYQRAQRDIKHLKL